MTHIMTGGKSFESESQLAHIRLVLKRALVAEIRTPSVDRCADTAP